MVPDAVEGSKVGSHLFLSALSGDGGVIFAYLGTNTSVSCGTASLYKAMVMTCISETLSAEEIFLMAFKGSLQVGVRLL